MWLKLVFGLFYLLTVFLFSRLLDIAVKSYDYQPFSIFPSQLVISPVVLGVRHLKQVLDYRGISYAGFWEKRELRELVEASGDVSEEELGQSSLEDENSPSSSPIKKESSKLQSKAPNEMTKFTCGAHFYELVEDTKDSAWLVLVKV